MATSPVRIVATQTAEPGELTIEVVGELDLAGAEYLSHEAGRVLEQPGVHTLTIELTEVTFMASAGVNSLLSLRSQAAERRQRLLLGGLSPAVRRILSLTNAFADREGAASRAVGPS